jgi:hypothetical protein
VSHKITSVTLSYVMLLQNVDTVVQLSGQSNNVGKLCVTCREVDEQEPGSRNLYMKHGCCGSSCY